MFVADEMKDVTQEFSDSSSSTQQSSAETMVHSEQMETVLEARTRNNLHFILCISPVSPAQICPPADTRTVTSLRVRTTTHTVRAIVLAYMLGNFNGFL